MAEVSCASLGGLQGDTTGETTSPSALAEDARGGLKGQCDSRGPPGGAAPLGHDVALALSLAPEHNVEALFLLPWGKIVVAVC